MDVQTPPNGVNWTPRPPPSSPPPNARAATEINYDFDIAVTKGGRYRVDNDV
jgi:hypothetical protein